MQEFNFFISDYHHDHWLEPKTLTEMRTADEMFCKSCGEEIPWHGNSCRLLKQAYMNRKSKCMWCDEEHQTGAHMFVHTTTHHKDEIDALGAKLSPNSPFATKEKS